MERKTTKHQVLFGSERIEFYLTTVKRSTLSITVKPDLSVCVVAPLDAAQEKILERVKKRAPWIIKQRSYFEQFLPQINNKEYYSGESFFYLGKQYRLRIQASPQESVTMTRGVLLITLPDPKDKSSVQALLRTWYREKAKSYFINRIELCTKRFSAIALPKFSMSIRKMKLRWGSCTKNGLIILNEGLIQAPSHCIDYVICHELTHLKVRNHTPEFFKILSRVMPDWEMRRERLEKVIHYHF